ncbi:related to DHA14-like major facilitator efflux transporter (MFS transporter) [Cephalotrichum gorgonifer]|uniref:Related to DHA14-like major facilitator efflux transporter (MFS transporter) n=1 Tax=Cephalotrichum gorgonifer TaxID=2041049 RepID=A0AAE8MVD1_9PEZI|nr:related to DHA14-like major facilitator efflux transporter (MFS transporter) [Cephalotrichum gorgonifer]
MSSPSGTSIANDGTKTPPQVLEDEVKSPGLQMGALRRRTLMLSLSLTLFLAALDVTIVATALPTIARTLNATAAQYAWVGSAYTLASTSSTPIWAKFSDIFGRKSVLLVANGAFIAGSLVAALAPSATELIGGRILQGLGGGGINILITIIIGDLFELKERAKYYGLTALVYAVASAVGPILGGVFTQTIGWRWCFWINLPFEVLSILVLVFVLRLKSPTIPFAEGLMSLDWIGSIIIVGGTICFLFGLETGASGSQGWSSDVVISLMTVGAVLLVSFFIYEAKLATNPIIPSHIFAKTTNLAAFATACIQSFVFIAYDYFLPLYFQVVLGFEPIISGVALFALVIPLSLATMAAGLFVARTGDFLLPTRAAVVVMTAGTGLFISFDGTASWVKIILFLMVAGVGTGPLFQMPMIALQSHVQPVDVAASMSAFNFMRSLFSSASIVVGSVILQKSLPGDRLDLGHNGGGADESASDDTRLYVHALRTMWIVYTSICGLMLVATVFIRKAGGKKVR